MNRKFGLDFNAHPSPNKPADRQVARESGAAVLDLNHALLIKQGCFRTPCIPIMKARRSSPPPFIIL